MENVDYLQLLANRKDQTPEDRARIHEIAEQLKKIAVASPIRGTSGSKPPVPVTKTTIHGGVETLPYFTGTRGTRLPLPQDAQDDLRLLHALLPAYTGLERELAHLVRLMEPQEKEGGLDIPGLATLNGARAVLAQAKGLRREFGA